MDVSTNLQLSDRFGGPDSCKGDEHLERPAARAPVIIVGPSIGPVLFLSNEKRHYQSADDDEIQQKSQEASFKVIAKLKAITIKVMLPYSDL